MLISIGYFWLQNLQIEGQKLIKQKLEICKLKINAKFLQMSESLCGIVGFDILNVDYCESNAYN